MKFRKRPVVIEATQWFKNGDHPLDDVMRPYEDSGMMSSSPREGKIVRYFRHPDVPGESPCISSIPCGKTMHEHGWIDTPEGVHNVCPGDWIVTGVKGEMYPVKDSIFRATYERVEEGG